MQRSSRIGMHDLRSIHRLVGECRELGNDATTWHRHLIEGLAGLTGGAIGFLGEVTGLRGDRPRHLGSSDWGWGCESERSEYYENFADFVAAPASYSSLAAYRRLFLADDGVCASRTQLFDDRRWESTKDYQIVLRPLRAGYVLWCNRSLPGAAADVSIGIHLLRPGGRRDFGARDRAVVEEIQVCLAPLVGGPLASFADPSPMALPPQARRVLRCLLEGDTDKQIASRMRLSPHTVNQYTKVIFRHFHARSRTELMARWIRRGWCLPPDPPSGRFNSWS